MWDVVLPWDILFTSTLSATHVQLRAVYPYIFPALYDDEWLIPSVLADFVAEMQANPELLRAGTKNSEDFAKACGRFIFRSMLKEERLQKMSAEQYERYVL